jgi:hypothetical protein
MGQEPTLLSFRQTGFSQAFRPEGEIFGPAQRHPIPEIGLAECRIELAHMRHRPVGFRHASGKRIACRRNADGGKVSGKIAQCLPRARGGVIKAPRQQVRERRPGLHPKHLGIKRTEAHGARQVLYRHLRLAAKDPYLAAGVPRPRQVRIEHEGAIDQGDGRIDVADHKGERMGAPRESDRVIRA